MYKLIAVDMDGTLLSKDNTISEENKIAIEKANKQGVKVVLSTGRPVKGIQKYLKELNLLNKENYSVTYNGSVVVNNGTGEFLSKTLLNSHDAKYLYDLSQKYDIFIHALTTKGCISPKFNKYTELEITINNIPFEEVDFNAMDTKEEIVKIMFVGPEDKLDYISKNLPREVLDKYTVVRSYKYFLEFLDKNVNKGSGVKALAEKLNIKQDEVICIGDAGNDVHMIEYASLGVAMGNAYPEVKNIADFVTFTNDESGVAHVINKFILNK